VASRSAAAALRISALAPLVLAQLGEDLPAGPAWPSRTSV
jgi:hypothetical protein